MGTVPIYNTCISKYSVTYIKHDRKSYRTHFHNIINYYTLHTHGRARSFRITMIYIYSCILCVV